jgi:hypothetical protein
MSIHTRLVHGSSIDSVIVETLNFVLENGQQVEGPNGLSIGAGRETREVENLPIELTNMRCRVPTNPGVTFNLYAAVGRLAWTLAASNRLSEIEFYDAGASRFSDDGLTIPGSCDGYRLFNPRVGVNQLEEVVRLLRDEPSSRRAFAVVYQAEDAGRRSCDVPCIVGIGFSIRHNLVNASLIMRSSNVVRLLAHDIFTYTMLVELVAAAIDRDLGTLHVFCLSSHVYSDEMDRALAWLRTPVEAREVAQMSPIPCAEPLSDARAFARAESRLRALPTRIDGRVARDEFEAARRLLPDYWLGCVAVLLRPRLGDDSQAVALRKILNAHVVNTFGVDP